MWNGRLTVAALLVAALVLVASGGPTGPSKIQPIRMCATKDDEKICADMKKTFESVNGVKIECHLRASRSKCLYDVGRGKLDSTYAWQRDIYSAGKQYSLLPVVGYLASNTTTPEVPYTWASIAVMRKGSVPDVKKLEDLRGKRSCHTAVGRNMAWALPLSLLQVKGLLKGSVDCLDNVENAAKFFQQSCAPGSQDSFYNSLRQNISNLCLSCGSPPPQYCTEQDMYANYSGDFKALSEGRCDVGYSTQTMIFKLTEGATEVGKRVEDFELLCLDGTRKPVTDYKTCNWGWFGNSALMLGAHRSEDLSAFRQELLGLEAQVKPKGINLFVTDDAVFGNDTYGMQDPKSTDYNATLGPDMVRMMENQTFTCDAGTPSIMRWCTISPPELEKCERMAVAFQSSFIKPGVVCVSAKSTEECMAKIKSGEADLLNVDGGDIYTAGKAYGLKPIVAENYGNKGGTYYAVAVVKSSDTNITFTNLKGRKSCHTAVARTAGWNVPTAVLVDAKQIDSEPAGAQCRHLVPVSKFFSQSCAPGALDEKSEEDVSNLCALCKGQGKDKCSRSDKEPYFGYVGALRCLVEGGDVAFVNHLTVLENTGGKNTADWAKNLKASDFQLLCKDGSRKPVDQPEDCHLATVPAHAVVTAGDKTKAQVNAFQQALAKASNFFVSSSIHFDGDFVLYGPGEEGAPKDIIFRDGIKSLVSLTEEEQDYVKYLGNYIITARFMDCPKTA